VPFTASVSVQTLAPSSLFSFNSPKLTEVARQDARVAWAVAEELNRRLYDTLQQIAINTFGSVKQSAGRETKKPSSPNPGWWHLESPTRSARTFTPSRLRRL